MNIQDIGNLSDVFGCSLDPGGNVEISGSLTFHLCIEDFDLASAVVQHLRLPDAMQVVAKFAKLVLYNDKNCARSYLPSREHATKIGTALLQLPVEGGHQGGTLNVIYGEQSKRIDTERSSDTRFYLYAFYDCCKHFIEPVSRGHQLIAVYDIHWVNAKTAMFKDFPWFLASIQQLWEAHVSGIHNAQVGYTDHGRPEAIVEKPLTGTAITRDSRQVAQFCPTFGPPVLAGPTRR
ncbi:hypothetical protein DAPPUDRAFT_331563 [Daphnia pulex]|uniref:Prolyl 4-hydroxylase alpha subunit Fe(2+) 2OG dioxygenase domain-containing protein n=1 Tax=Daphnia pulex TaxID=6669 RepID=E9HMT7_DAPPU|nr:hypothetical protein DAPPUDRAFT_331563 [Daphnia pulex]|eukprot:EFX66920.1 hypothetical protein DAPPUDRAFT_331563 [Daphnia pulex]